VKKRYYVGLRWSNGARESFRAAVAPTSLTYPEYTAVIGPFRTRRGALFMRDCGRNNPHVQTVADAERLAKALTLGAERAA
jgi:hypothetical protein